MQIKALQRFLDIRQINFGKLYSSNCFTNIILVNLVGKIFVIVVDSSQYVMII